MVGGRIKEYLVSHGIKQSFVAEKVGITNDKMSQILKSASFDCVIYYKICKTLDVPYETFIEGE